MSNTMNWIGVKFQRMTNNSYLMSANDCMTFSKGHRKACRRIKTILKQY